VFKDELLRQLPENERARRLSQQTFLFSDFVAAQNFAWPQLDVTVVMHGHCHQKALFGMQGDKKLLDLLGVRWTLIDAGCCGMAGSFGFNSDHYSLSMQIGEDRLLPAVRQAAADTIILTNGFSCREQIEQGAGRRSMHIAELALQALRALPALSSEATGVTIGVF